MNDIEKKDFLDNIETIKVAARDITTRMTHGPAAFLFFQNNRTEYYRIDTDPGIFLPILLRRFRPEAYIFVSEAWISSINPDDPASKDQLELLRKLGTQVDPLRREVLQMIACVNHEEPIIWLLDITREEGNNNRIIGEWKRVKYLHAHGLLAIREW